MVCAKPACRKKTTRRFAAILPTLQCMSQSGRAPEQAELEALRGSPGRRVFMAA